MIIELKFLQLATQWNLDRILNSEMFLNAAEIYVIKASVTDEPQLSCSIAGFMLQPITRSQIVSMMYDFAGRHREEFPSYRTIDGEHRLNERLVADEQLSHDSPPRVMVVDDNKYVVSSKWQILFILIEWIVSTENSWALC